MQFISRAKSWTLLAATAAVLWSSAATAQSKPTLPVPSQFSQDVGQTQQQFLKLLRNSPTLTTVIAHDPSLLGDAAYVQRNNPELARFLASHPEVVQDADFYLFSKVGPGQREQALARQVWPDFVPPQLPQQNGGLPKLVDEMQPILILPALFFCMAWMVKLFVEGRRQSRAAKMQGEFHARLIDKFASSQELIAYMESEAGRRFLEAAPASLQADTQAPLPNVLNRILTPVQIGAVLSMLGIGMISIRHASNEGEVGMLIAGTLLLMPGLGFILSAGATWFLARRMGLMPAPKSTESADLQKLS